MVAHHVNVYKSLTVLKERRKVRDRDGSLLSKARCFQESCDWLRNSQPRQVDRCVALNSVTQSISCSFTGSG